MIHLVIVLFLPLLGLAGTLPSLELCQGAKISSTVVGDGLQYQCLNSCTGNLNGCSTCDSEGICQLTFVTDQMAGHLFYNAVSNVPTMVFHQGGGGDTRLPPDVLNPLRQSGLRVVEIQWEKGAQTAKGPTAIHGGWFTRKSASGSNLRQLSARPAAVIKWIHDNLVDQEAFGVAGCSGGSVATFSAVYFHGIGNLLQYQWLGGGPYYDIGWACGGGPSAYVWNPLFPNVNALMDYVHATGRTCQDHKDSPLFAVSSPRRSAGSWTFNHPVDFNGSYKSMLSDSFMGIRNHQLTIYQMVQAKSKTLNSVEDSHCGKLAAIDVCERVCSRMLSKNNCGCETIQSGWTTGLIQ